MSCIIQIFWYNWYAPMCILANLAWIRDRRHVSFASALACCIFPHGFRCLERATTQRNSCAGFTIFTVGLFTNTEPCCCPPVRLYVYAVWAFGPWRAESCGKRWRQRSWLVSAARLHERASPDGHHARITRIRRDNAASNTKTVQTTRK